MEVKERKLAELIPAEYNPRYIGDEAFEQLQASLKRFEAVEPIIVNMHPDRRNIIVGGHMRAKAAKALGWSTFPCVEIELDRDREKELNIRLNKNTGVFDFDKLANFFDVDELTSWGFTEEELFAEVEDPGAEAQEDNFDPTPPEKAITQPGDLYQIGEHRLLCGDSTDPEQAALLMQGELADMVMTDPPYNVAYEGGTGMTIMNDEMEDGDFYAFLSAFYKTFSEVTKKGGAWYVWHADSEGVNFRKAFKENGLLLKQCLVWVKNALVMGRQDYHWKHEPCLYGWKEGAAHYFTDDRTNTTVIEDKVDLKKLKKDELLAMLTEILSDTMKTTVIHHDKPLKNAEHPTMKPILLLAPLIQNSSKRRELVVDPFLGSGSTMVAAHQLKRKCYGMEMDPKYCDVIVKRMMTLDPKLEVKLNGKDYGLQN